MRRYQAVIILICDKPSLNLSPQAIGDVDASGIRKSTLVAAQH
jgi:hypothetical protein